ncbi:hypothetical protein Tco_0748081 [Tanacetum coccineum]|uniref:Retrotransposon gag domain-containing protein n=1 Tax=Tanacetum coccineum TaxID=301880 RepID=A0ABQ4YUT5_9ASTR
MKTFMLLKSDANNTKDPTTLKIAHKKKKGKPLKKLTIFNLVDLFKEGDIEQLLQDTIKGTTPTLHFKNKGNLTLLYKPRQTTVPFPGCLEEHYCEEEGSYGPKFMEAYGASLINNTIPQKEKDPGSFTLPCFINDFCFDNALVDLGASISVMPLSTYLNLGLGRLAHTRLIVELADGTVKYPKGIAENILVVFLVNLLSQKITFRVGEEKIVFKSIKPASSLIKRVYMLSLREIMKLDLEARLMGETLVFNRSLDPFSEDFIELYDLNEPIKLRRNQGDDLMPTIKEGKVIEEFRARNDNLNAGIEDCPSYCDEEATYLMVRSHPRFKNHTNEKCNKILPLLKVSNKDMKNGISHTYQKLNGFYKGVLNLGPDYIRHARMEEYLTCGHQQSQQQIKKNTKILEALNIREQPKRDKSRYGSSSDEDEEGVHADPANQQRSRMPRIKVDILTFSGSLNIEKFLDWVFETEKYFELMDILEDSQVKYVAYKLRGAALSWWDNL